MELAEAERRAPDQQRARLCAQPTAFALVGLRTIAETVSTFQVLPVTLTPDEVRWLNLERDTP